MKTSEITYLLGVILGLSYNKKKELVKSLLLQEEMDWVAFTQLGNKFLVLPALYYELRHAQLLECLPEELLEHLKLIYDLSKQRNQEIRRQYIELAQVFAKEKITPIVLKGGGNLFRGLYPDDGVRIMTDLDLLVDDASFIRAAELVKSLDYQSAFVFEDVYTSIEQAKDYPRLFKANVPADIEIHRLPVALEFKKHFGFDFATQNYEEILLDESNSVRFLNYKNEAILNFIHSQLTDKGYLYKSINLKNMYDLWLLHQKVNVEKALSDFGYYNKQAQSYWQATNSLFLGTFYEKGTLGNGDNLYLTKALYYLDHPDKYFKHKKRKYIFWRIGYSYIKFPISTIFNADNRRLLILKLSHNSWYKKHFKSFNRLR